MSAKRILVVEDDPAILELISYNLKQEGYAVTEAVSGEDALSEARSQPPDLVLLDLMLPEMDGLEVCRQLKADKATRAIPLIMVTAKGEESDVVAGLELGAHDYVTKPFRPRELVARVRAILRRISPPSDNGGEMIAIHGLEIDPNRREVLLKGRPVDLTYTQFEILHLLAQRPGWVLTRYQIVDGIRGENHPVTDRSVDVQIAALRKQLGKTGAFIETVRGVGYRMKDLEA